jgi:hypothetical protein
MAKNQEVDNANELWQYFNGVITWIQAVFPNTRKEMKGLLWGELYNKYGKKKYKIAEMEKRIT